jgi:heat shock protein HslJ
MTTSTSRRFARWTTLSLALLLFASCGSGGDPIDAGGSTDETTDGPIDPAALDGRAFLSTATDGITLVDSSIVRLEFDAGSLGVQAGCNSMGGGYTIENGRLVVAEMMTTAMDCDGPLMDQDVAVAAFLAASPSVSLVGDTLTLTGDGISLTLTDRVVADPDRPLEGTTWTVMSVLEGDVAWTGWGDAVATITIVDGTAQVGAGCNGGSASVEVGGATLTFGPLALTRKACEPDVMALEQAVVSVLAGEVSYSIEAGMLTLWNGSVGLQLTAE